MVRVATAERFRSSYLKDLSEGGLFIKTSKPLPIGREAVIDLLPPGFTSPLRLTATVVRHGPDDAPGMGVRFAELTPENREALRALIQSYESAAVPPNLPAATADPTRDLEALLEQYSILRTMLEARDRELAAERGRHEDVSQRALKLAADLEAAQLRPEGGPSSSELRELHASLSEKEAELTEARMRISELEGSLQAYQSEVQVLEQDDANSRRLASALAHEKIVIGKEAERLAAELTRERQASQHQLRELQERLSASDTAAKEIISLMQEDLDAKQLAVNRTSGKTSTLEAQLAEQVARQASFDAELKSLRTQNTALMARAGQAERAGQEAGARLERMRIKERELRALLAAVGSPGKAEEDEVVIKDEAPAAAPDPDPVTVPAMFALQPPRSSDTAVEFATPEAVAPSTPVELPEFDVAEAEEVDLSISMDSSPGRAPFETLSRAEFEKRLRANEELTRTPRFDSHEPRDAEEKDVKGLLEAGLRFSELMVLGRGLVTPPQLLEVLFRLHEVGVITYR